LNIVIVGGGTAGWLAALMISKAAPKNTVTVIESSKISIVGAGEGSTGVLTNIIRGDLFDFGCDMLEFMKESNATIKYGIHHKDWKTVGESYFAPLAGSPTSTSIIDFTFCTQSEINPNNMHLLHRTGAYAESNKSPFSINDFSFENIGFALHFDAFDVGRYFKKVVLKHNNTSWVDDEVTTVNLDNETGFIKSLKLKSGKDLKGDFFIDASGFSKVLMIALGNSWVSYQEHLPVNSAMPFLIPYNDNETPEPWTTAWAQSSGWMWQIPTLERKGCGYVFCDDFITPEQAQDEIEKTLGHSIDPIRVLKFETGRLDKAWVKNCLAIGLASAFAEPLEATSIHSTIIQLLTFVFEYLKDDQQSTCNNGSINFYNKRTSKMYDDFKDFLNVHYMGGRTDSKFWEYIHTGATQTEKTKDLLEMAKCKMPSNKDFDLYTGGVDWGLYSYILFGTGNLSTSVLSSSLDSINDEGYREFSQSVLNEYKEESLSSMKNKLNYDKFIEFLRK